MEGADILKIILFSCVYVGIAIVVIRRDKKPKNEN